MRQIIVLAHNIRSAHNVGSLLRTAEGLGIERVILSGYTPYPAGTGDRRLPHEAARIAHRIEKTALGAAALIAWEHIDDPLPRLEELRRAHFAIVALEQTATSLPLPAFSPPEKMILILGREVEGVESNLLDLSDTILEIPMYGRKESYNVIQAAAMALYHCRFFNASL